MAEAMSETSASSWYDDAPITDAQIESVRRDLDLPVAERGAAFAPFVVRKLLAEVERLNTVLDANRVVRNAAESSSRTYKAVVDRLKAERTRLRAELDKCAALNRDLVNENAELTVNLDQARAQLAEIGETREEYAVAIENLPEPEAPGSYAVPAWYGGYEDGLAAAIRIVRGEQREVPDA